MEIDKYIDWNALWGNEVLVEDINLSKTSANNLKAFKTETDLTLIEEECYISNNKIFILFSETGGIHEGDSQGWSRDYLFILDNDFLIIDVVYEQG